jgi:hypothetical protein
MKEEYFRFVIRNDMGFYASKTGTLAKSIEDARTFLLEDTAQMWINRTVFKYNFSVIKIKVTIEEV